MKHFLSNVWGCLFKLICGLVGLFDFGLYKGEFYGLFWDLWAYISILHNKLIIALPPRNFQVAKPHIKSILHVQLLRSFLVQVKWVYNYKVMFISLIIFFRIIMIIIYYMLQMMGMKRFWLQWMLLLSLVVPLSLDVF